MVDELLLESQPPDPELADLIEWAFLDDQIDGVTLSLAYNWLTVNHPCEQ